MKYLPDTYYHSYIIVMTKVDRAKTMIRKDDKSSQNFSPPSQILTSPLRQLCEKLMNFPTVLTQLWLFCFGHSLAEAPSLQEIHCGRFPASIV